MKNRLVVLASVLLALVVLYIVGLLVYGGRPEEVRLAFPGIENPNVLTLDQPSGESLTLEQTGQGWQVVGGGPIHPARSQRIEDFVAALQDSRVGRLVGSGDAVLQELELTDETAYSLSVHESERTIEALFGQAGTTAETLYYRTPASTDAYLLESSIRFYLTQRPAYWSDLRVFFGSIPNDSIVRIDVDVPDAEASSNSDYTVFQSSDTADWAFDGLDNPVDQSRISALLRTAATIEATRFIPYQGDIRWDRVVRLYLADGRVFSLYAVSDKPEPRIMAEGPGLPADEDGFPYHYRISQANLDRVFPSAEALSLVE